MVERRCWLMKTEPDVFSFDDLMARPGRREAWDCIRNYQSRNTMRDLMRVGDEVLVYHSSCAPPHVAGLGRVASVPRPDPTQFDPQSPYFDPKATVDSPRWVLVDIDGDRALERPVPLDEMKAHPALQQMMVIRKGMRLSIQPVSPAEFDAVVAMAKA